MTAFRDDADLEQALRDLAQHIELPPVPALAPLVRHGLRASPHHRHRLRLGALVLAVIVLSGLVGLPPVRAAVARLFTLPGVLVERGAPPPLPLGHNLGLGKPVSPAGARAIFPLLLPSQPSLGPPDSMYLAYVPGSPRITALYHARRSLPRTPTTGVGILLTEFRTQPDRLLMEKTLGMNATVRQVRIGNVRGYWIAGPPHYLFFRGANGVIFNDSLRLAGNTLLWTQHGITLRLESALDRRAAVAVARSVRAWNQ